MRPSRLSEQEVKKQLGDCPDWSIEEGKLHREFEFEDFQQAFDFMARVAEVAESMNHHPEWFNVYNRVRVDLTTHDAAGITSLDFELARAMNRFAS